MSKRYLSDGHLRPVMESDLVPGTVIRFVNSDGTSPPFDDSIVVDVDGDLVKLVRPYVFAHLRSYLAGQETFSVSQVSLLNGSYRTVLLASGDPYNMILGD